MRRPAMIITSVLLTLAIHAAAVAAIAADAAQPCDPAQPLPPLVVVLPDGSEVAASRVDYDLAARRIVVVGSTRIYCDTFEGE